MSEKTAATPPATALHLPTVIAIAVVAYALTNVAHEGLGHGGMCVAMGGEPRVLNAVYFECGRDGVTVTVWFPLLNTGATVIAPVHLPKTLKFAPVKLVGSTARSNVTEIVAFRGTFPALIPGLVDTTVNCAVTLETASMAAAIPR